MRRATLLLLTALSGCMLYFDGGEGGGDDDCLILPEDPGLVLRNPETLTCDSFGGSGCDPACGPCPARVRPTPPLPSWGVCGSECEALDETTCAARADCRVVKNAACAISGTCLTDFLGCFPTDMGAADDLDCLAARDGWTCSASAACTAFHRDSSCLEPPCTRDFAFCMPEGATPGRCELATCRAVAPPCPEGTTPGVQNGCYTGACIPDDLCGL